MEKEIEEVIAKHLPAQVGELLKKTLEQGQKDAETVKTQKKMLDDASERIARQFELQGKYMELDRYKAQLDEREKIISEKERSQKVFEAELRLAEAEKRISEMANLTALVFRSPVYRKTTYENHGYMDVWSNSGGPNNMGGNIREKTFTTTTTDQSTD